MLVNAAIFSEIESCFLTIALVTGFEDKKLGFPPVNDCMAEFGADYFFTLYVLRNLSIECYPGE